MYTDDCYDDVMDADDLYEDDGWGHEFALGSTPPEFDTREEQEIDRL